MKKVYATCIVRPFWFMQDGMRRTASARPLLGYKERAKHLQYFKKAGRIEEVRRILILTTEDISGILLTAYINNMVMASSDHKLATEKWTKKELPEIDWFHQEVNRNRGVDLFYFFKDDRAHEFLENLGDRVIVEEDNTHYYLKFSFAKGKEYSQTGDLELGFSENLCFHKWCKADDGKCKSFLELLDKLAGNDQIKIVNGCRTSFQSLKETLNVSYIDSLQDIGESKKEFLRVVMRKVSTESFSDNGSLKDFYKNLVDKGLEQKACLSRALIFEEGDKEFPVKIASWMENWKEIQ